MERATFQPAKDSKGRPVAGSYSSAVRWQLPDGERLTVPEGFQLVITSVIEKDGSVSSCQVTGQAQFQPGEGPCDKKPEFAPRLDAGGNPVRVKLVSTYSVTTEELPDEPAVDKQPQ